MQWAICIKFAAVHRSSCKKKQDIPMSDLAQTLIEESEGCVLVAYKDTLGFWTVGVGHRLTDGKDWTGYTITQEQADTLLQADMGASRSYAAAFPNFSSMNDVRQAVCVSMCFQLGSKPLHWPNFMAALRASDYTAAQAAGLDSLWAKQTPQRAQREMQMLQSGVWS
jgi:lysozyme